MKARVFFAGMTSVGRLLRLHPLRGLCSRTYHSYDHPPPPGPFNPVEHAILSASVPYVPAHGFTLTTLSLGAKDAGYLDASMNLFPMGAFSIVHHHLITQRLRLAKHQHAVKFGSNVEHLEVGSKVKALIWVRLEGNKQIIHRWNEVRFSPLIN
jgi:ubiquinone biosynthesis protein COQ9